MNQEWVAALPRAAGWPTTHVSVGFEQRGVELQSLARDAHRYLCRSLGTDFEPVLAVAAPADWPVEDDEAPPYGYPYATEDRHLVVAADLTDNPLVEGYTTVGTREEAERFADLIAVHELGHLHALALGFELPEGWLGEFLATYLLYCFLAAHRPDDAALWHRLAAAGATGVSPAHRSLEELDELYFGVGPDNYVWYQDVLTLRVVEVHAVAGVDFVARLRTASLTPTSDTAASLAAAEAASPGFEAWAATLRP